MDFDALAWRCVGRAIRVIKRTGLSFLAFRKGSTRLLGIACLSAPAILFRLIAPLPQFEIGNAALSSIERRFILGVLGSSLLFWIFLGASSGQGPPAYLYIRDIGNQGLRGV